jgi:glycosyltransferase involved in cell wall biosynthesis
MINPVAVVPNGIDSPQPQSDPTRLDRRERVVLSLGRVHPKKGLDRLVCAWAEVEAVHPGWVLRIVGPSEAGHDVELRAMAAALGLRRLSMEIRSLPPAARPMFLSFRIRRRRQVTRDRTESSTLPRATNRSAANEKIA